MEFRLLFIHVTIILVSIWVISVAEPCSSYSMFVADIRRSAAYIHLLHEAPLCDAVIDEKWYRIDSPISNDLVTSCPDLFRCGTNSPLWMNGSIPHIQDGIVNRTVCTSGALSCCDNKLNIKVKNCGSYRVYFLKQTKGCPEAYCFGTTLATSTVQTSSRSGTALETSMVQTTVRSGASTEPSTVQTTSTPGTSTEPSIKQTTSTTSTTSTPGTSSTEPSTAQTTSTPEIISTISSKSSESTTRSSNGSAMTNTAVSSSWSVTSKTTMSSDISVTELQKSENDDLTKIVVICTTLVILAVIASTVIIKLRMKKSSRKPDQAKSEIAVSCIKQSEDHYDYYYNANTVDDRKEVKENVYEIIKDNPELPAYDDLYSTDKNN